MDDKLIAGECVQISPLVRRIVAPNPGLMTGPGTNTYIVGQHKPLVIDPGPDDLSHCEQIIEQCEVPIFAIAVTHTHPDHMAGVLRLASMTGAKVMAFENSPHIAATHWLTQSEHIITEEYDLEIIHTPGHASNHVCYLLTSEKSLFSGDHIMQGSTVVINPPDGDMGAYFHSLEKLLDRDIHRIFPGHGTIIEDPVAEIQKLLVHRKARESKVIECLVRIGPTTVSELVMSVYDDVPEFLYPIAQRSLYAHLLKLYADEIVSCDNNSIDGVWKTKNLI